MDAKKLSCQEIILDDVIGISLCVFDEATFSRPRNVASSSILVQGEYTVMGRFHFSDPESQFLLSQSPAISLTTARSEQGLIYTHELTMTISEAFTEAEKVAILLQHNDFAIIYQKADGSYSLSLPLPNTTSILVEETVGSSPTVTVKTRMQSMSGLIMLNFVDD